jgi:hypothetical protein
MSALNERGESTIVSRKTALSSPKKRKAGENDRMKKKKGIFGFQKTCS